MASQRSTNTMMEVLQRMLQDIAIAKTLPDADLQFLISLETMILQKLKAPIDAASGAMGGGSGAGPVVPPGVSPAPDATGGALLPPAGGPMGPGGGPMPGPMGGGPMPAGAGAGVAGVRQGAAMPPVDELRRMLGQ